MHAMFGKLLLRQDICHEASVRASLKNESALQIQMSRLRCVIGRSKLYSPKLVAIQCKNL